jgi:hypothetical protein
MLWHDSAMSERPVDAIAQKEAARILGYHVRTVGTYITAGRLRPAARSIHAPCALEPARGLEPLTFRLQVGCATNCATPARCRAIVVVGKPADRGRPAGTRVHTRRQAATAAAAACRGRMTTLKG